jgi:hypothetical protein
LQAVWYENEMMGQVSSTAPLAVGFVAHHRPLTGQVTFGTAELAFLRHIPPLVMRQQSWDIAHFSVKGITWL